MYNTDYYTNAWIILEEVAAASSYNAVAGAFQGENFSMDTPVPWYATVEGLKPKTLTAADTLVTPTLTTPSEAFTPGGATGMTY